MRVVINAISLETIWELKEILSLYEIAEEEIVHLQAARMKNSNVTVCGSIQQKPSGLF